jgi:hypothetical protein
MSQLGHHAAGKKGFRFWVVGSGVWTLAPRTQNPKPKTFLKGGKRVETKISVDRNIAQCVDNSARRSSHGANAFPF